MPNPFVHVELNTNDLPAAKKFYKGLFDWKLEDVKMGPGMVYTMLDVGQGTGGGMQRNPMPNSSTHWLSYVLVDDLTKTMAKARKLGATICVDRQDVMGMGALGIFIDPTGAALGVWEPEPRMAAKKKAAKKAAKKSANKKAAKKSKRK